MPLHTQGLPAELKSIHILGICGTAMGSIAGMLKDAGYAVTGSDTGAYPPMSDYLASLGITIQLGYVASNLDHDPDLVVVGNVIRATYEEAVAVVERDMDYCSFPHVLGELFMKDATSIVCAGTHGKTTTSSITAWLADAAGLNPGYLIGGVVKGWDRTARAGGGTHFVIEGDEYDTAFFDKRPKFMSYRANTAILTSVEFDHADIYRDLEHCQEAFRDLVRSMPEDGCVVARWDHPSVRAVCEESPCEVRKYGPDQDWDGRIERVDHETGTMTFTVLRGGETFGTFTSNLVGEHNLYNQVAAVAALEREGCTAAQLAEGFRTFRGIKRRQDVVAEPGGVTILDDFAHHPTAVQVTTEALRLRFGGRRLWVVFEPRSNTSRRKIFQEPYAEAFGEADLVTIKATYDERIPLEERLDPHELAGAIRARGTEASCLDKTDDIVALVAANALEGDVVAVYSNGGFDGIHKKLVEALEQRFGRATEG
ncbi:MAG: UDP-N-acetylmuramate:L-alanyl-gamma-D-glutamyl-meso-diaminopimelate ligase [Proteobacteria bacterium]|nr:UDP-N-acetylmuramate:L-alanyl-gamma-D-glutamyl-meso-diaminopimelate ligase [Pseudomonadota bacterium]MCP4917883.1 UDP-N-acetylmuramate:L-alanyl-gamma-D-glutamyl-meso-diaminopimelate ligase [Pseudomonadota bacterium]